MIFEQFYLGCLAHASYLIGSDGIAAVIDPQRDVEIYLETAQRHNLQIAHVIETHLHADFVSGHVELAARSRATIYLGEGSGARFAHRAVRDGDEIRVGHCALRFLRTPGHTIESVCVLVTDLERGAEPYAVFTGDTLFIGDVGRPDLDETHTPAQLAGLLYDSIHSKLLTLPDSVLVYPAHGAGSMCGRSISPERSSTIGRERQWNYALRPMTREQFVGLVTEGLPERPEYFHRDAKINREGAPTLAELPALEPQAPQEVERLKERGVFVLDTRPANAFCSGHIPGSINIALGGQFASWAGTVLGLDCDIILVAEDLKSAGEARYRLARVGIERVRGFVADGISGWVREGFPLQSVDQWTVEDLHEELSGGSPPRVLDVRREPEWRDGHIPGALHRPLSKLSTDLRTLDPQARTAVHCKSGYRSAIACSLLKASAFRNVVNVLGGYDAWSAAGLPIVKEATPETAR
jgi:hydroxyacylglutathione hydrolase